MSARDPDATYDDTPAADATLSFDEPTDAAPPAAPAPAPRYTLTDELGRGGLGRVVRATDEALDREVAYKTLLRDTFGARRRFDREARISTRPASGRRLVGHDDAVTELLWSQDGTTLYSGDLSGQVRAWRDDLPTDGAALRAVIQETARRVAP